MQTRVSTWPPPVGSHALGCFQVSWSSRVHTRVSTRPLREPPPVGTHALGCFQVSWSSRVDSQRSWANDSHISVSSPSYAHPRPPPPRPSSRAGRPVPRAWVEVVLPTSPGGVMGAPSPSPSDGLSARCQASLPPHVGGPVRTHSPAFAPPDAMQREGRHCPRPLSHVPLSSRSSICPEPWSGHSFRASAQEPRQVWGGRAAPASSPRRPLHSPPPHPLLRSRPAVTSALGAGSRL